MDDHSFYSVENGIWFVATWPTGPWAVATSVPAVIYSIPPSSPLYYVTYLRVYGSTPDCVYDGYIPGYLGTVVSPDDVVVYGTGYYYPPTLEVTGLAGHIRMDLEQKSQGVPMADLLLGLLQERFGVPGGHPWWGPAWVGLTPWLEIHPSEHVSCEYL